MEEQDEITIDLRELFATMLKNWVAILMVLILAALAGYGIGKFLITPKYEASVNLLVSTRDDPTAVVTNDNISSAKSLVATYAVIIKSNIILDEVVQKANVSYTTEQLSKMIECTQVNDTMVIKVTATSKSKNEAYRILQSLTEVAPDQIENTIQAGVCRVASKVYVADKPVTSSPIKVAAIAAALAFVACIAFFIIKKLVQNYIVDDLDIEEFLGLNVIGVIPEIRVGDK